MKRTPAKAAILTADEMGSREAQAILEINSTMFHRLIEQGRLPARMLDKRGAGFRRWIVKRSDVLRLKSEGVRKNRPPRPHPQYAYWARYFGRIPDGCMPVFRDGNPKNLSPANLCLLPKKQLWLPEAKGLRTQRKKKGKVSWTKEQLAKLRQEYADRLTAELAKELAKSTASPVLDRKSVV